MKTDDRFGELLALARNGNEEAVGDLWREFGYAFKNASPAGDLNRELLPVLALASEERKADALRVLRGEPIVHLPRDPGPEPFLTLRDISKRTGVSTCSLWRWKVPGHELGGRRRFRLSEVLAYLESDAFRARVKELKAERRSSSRRRTHGPKKKNFPNRRRPEPGRPESQ